MSKIPRVPGPRRSPNTGSIAQTPTGRYQVQVSVRAPTPAGALPHRGQPPEANRTLRLLLEEVDRGGHRGGRIRLSDYLTEYLETTVRPLLARDTYSLYRLLATRHIAPVLGHLTLDEVTPAHVQTLAALRLKRIRHRPCAHSWVPGRGTPPGGRFRSDRAQPVSRVRKPPQGKRSPPAMTAAEGRAVLAAVAGTRIAGLVTCALVLGLRMGELLGLRWSDVDLSARTVTIERQYADIRNRSAGEPTRAYRPLKAAREVCTLPLPTHLALALRRHRSQARLIRLAAGRRWVEHDAVFPGRWGSPRQPEVVNREFRQALSAAGLRPRTLHECRHGTATLLASLGVPLSVTQAILGHRRGSAVTASVYVHTAPASIQAAMDALDRALGD